MGKHCGTLWRCKAALDAHLAAKEANRKAEEQRVLRAVKREQRKQQAAFAARSDA